MTTPAEQPIVDRAFVERAIRTANPNALRLALYQQTGDPRLAAMSAGPVPVAGGALRSFRLGRDHTEELVDVALGYLTDLERLGPPVAPPAKADVAELFTMFTGAAPTEPELHWAYEDLAFADFPHDATWTAGPPAGALDGFSVAIIGAGISGIAIGIQLDRLGIDYRIIEQRDDIGGTWHVNDYPDVRVDIPARMYQYRFVKDYRWSSYFPTGAEIKAYIDHVADRYDVRRRIELNSELSAATWREDDCTWELAVRRANGQEETLHANVVISCVGLFNRPNRPDIDGLDSFEGAMFHTTEWDHEVDYSGQRVAVVGTGSTGTQLLSAVAERASHVSVFQRTPSWINPVKGYRATVPAEEQWLLDTLPGYRNWTIFAASLEEMQIAALQEMDPEWVARGGRVSERNSIYRERLVEFIRSKIGDDEELFEKLLPNYAPLARRLVIDNGFYDALQAEHVELVTDPIERVTTDSIITTDPESGAEVERPFDLIVIGSGFKVAEYMWPVTYTGRGGTTLEQEWSRDGARAHLGLSLPKFPNFFVIYGPNGQTRGGSFHVFATAFGRYIGELLVHLIENGHGSFEVRQNVFEGYNDAMDAESRKILWEHEGVGGYYVNEFGRSGVNMPWTHQQYYEWIRVPDPDDFDWTTCARSDSPSAEA